MITHTEFAKATPPEIILGLFDPAERFAGDGVAVSDSGGKTSRSWLVPQLQTCLQSKLADVGLGQSRLHEWSEHATIAGGLLAGTEIAAIIQVHAISQVLEAKAFARFFHFGKKLRLAEETAGRVVLHVVRILHLVGLQHLQRNALLPREGLRVLQMGARQRR